MRAGRRNGATGPFVLAAILVAIVLGVVLFLRSGSGGRSSAAEDDEPTGLIATVTECRAAGDTLWTVGTLRNAATIPIRNIEMSLTWTDANGDDVAEEIIELVGAEGLMVEETTGFRGFTLVPGAEECEAGVFFYEPIT